MEEMYGFNWNLFSFKRVVDAFFRAGLDKGVSTWSLQLLNPLINFLFKFIQKRRKKFTRFPGVTGT